MNSIIIQDNDYQLNGGQLVAGNQLITQIRALLVLPLGSYKHNSGIGSGLIKYLSGLNNLSQSYLRSMISNALEPLVSNGSITNLVVSVTLNPSGDTGFIINCTDNNGTPITFEWEYTGAYNGSNI